jgi:mannose-6-phosphate isomerase-like protein (cupin superfamily)
MTLMDIPGVVDSVRDPWWNQTLCGVNDCVLRLGIFHGEFHWHAHEHEDEAFFVVEGTLLLDLPESTVKVGPHQGFLVPRGVRHRTRAPERVVALMIEGKGVTPVGDD